MKELVLKLTALVRPVVIEDEKGDKVEYELREMKAADRDTYLTQFAGRCRVNDAGEVTSLVKFDGMQAELLRRTLYKKEDSTPVSIAEVQKWPATAVTQLFVAAQELNKLVKQDKATEEDEETKNA
jgi:hypothetical protein